MYLFKQDEIYDFLESVLSKATSIYPDAVDALAAETAKKPRKKKQKDTTPGSQIAAKPVRSLLFRISFSLITDQFDLIQRLVFAC